MSELSSPTLLTADHDLSGFDCGSEALNSFLRDHALANQRAMISRTYVVTRGNYVLGFYTLALLAVGLEEPPRSFVRGMPPYPVPAVLMARLGVDVSLQGKGLGRSLLTDALGRVWRLMKDGPAPARLFVVDAKDENAVKFYKRFDMVESPLIPNRLFLSYKTLRSLFEPS